MSKLLGTAVIGNAWLRQCILLSIVAIFSLATANAADYYVDPNLGDDTYDGSQPKPEGGDSKVGPRKTLVGVMKLVTANNGDVVHAAPGEYKDLKTTANYRVSIPAGTTLVASGKAEETFIVGAPASGVALDASPWGCGADAVRCVEMKANTKLIGFTVCGGRAPGVADNVYGGGIYAANSNNVVVADCIVSNNVSGRAGGMSSGIALRCEFMNNLAVKSGPHVMKSSLYNCYLHDALGGDVYPVYQSTMRNCHLIGGAKECNVFNSYVSSDRSSNKFHFSAYASKHSNSTAVTNCFTAASISMQLDENRRPLKGSHNGIDKGSYYYYTNSMPAVVAEMLGVDFKKGQRVHNGEIDIGCGEYDSRSDLAYSLAHSNSFSVDAATPEVAAGSSGSVIVPGGAEMAMSWNPPGDEVSGYGFKATVAGGAELVVYRDGKEVARWSADDGEQSLGYAASGAHTLRFVCEGEGSATVSKFKSMFGRSWYVNDETGSDLYDGTAPVPAGGDSLVGPRKTLAGAMAISGLTSGDVVHVAAGTYEEGEMMPTGGAGGTTTNRVVVKSGVGLVADDGPDVTFIVGKKPSEGGNTGPDAIRCVYLRGDAWLYGFTVTNGATCKDSESSYKDYGGGVCAESGACTVNCRFTMNSARRGGAAFGGWYIGCMFGQGNAANESSGIYDCHGVFNSYFDNCKPYGKWKIVNCTFKDCCPHGNTDQDVYNCLIETESGKNCNFYSCVFTGRHAGESDYDEATRFNATDAQRDAVTIRPTAESSLVDRGNISYYNELFPADWVMFKMFDLYRGQRVYGEGKIDVGAGEFDWRGAFAKALHASKATVAEASEGVRLSDGGEVVLGGGDRLVVDFSSPGGKIELRTAISGEGAASVTLDGKTLALDASGTTGVIVEEGLRRLEFAFEGAGVFAVSSIKSRAGMILYLR